MNPSVAPIVEIRLGSETRSLRLGFRAFKALGLNPFKPDTIFAYFEDLDPDKAAAFVRAGLLHEYAPGGPRDGQEPPAADELLDVLDVPMFMDIMTRCLEAAGLKPKAPEGEAQAEPDPPAARTGSPSGPSPDTTSGSPSPTSGT